MEPTVTQSYRALCQAAGLAPHADDAHVTAWLDVLPKETRRTCPLTSGGMWWSVWPRPWTGSPPLTAAR